MEAELNNILGEMEVNTKPTIMQIARWCKRAAEISKHHKRELAEEIFIMCEICLNHIYLTKQEIEEYKKEYPLLLKKKIDMLLVHQCKAEPGW